MDRTIRVRSTLTDRKEEELERLGREKEAELRAGGVTATPLFTSVCIAPDLEKGRLGYFSPQGRLIVISENLAWGDDGSALRGVFLHELAHALDFALNGRVSGHSALFRQYCSLLGLEPGFEKSRIRIDLDAREEKKERIRKLLALSSSPFENEAKEAIKKARMLMARESIEIGEEKNERIYMVTLHQAGRFPFSVRMLLSYISRITGVYIVTSYNGDGSKSAVAYGSLEETEASIYLYDYLMSSAEREIAKLRKKGRRVTKDSFLQGALSVLVSGTADESADRAIIAVQNENQRLAKKLVFPDTKIVTTTKRSHAGDAGSYAEGKGFGSKLDIPPAIGRKKIGCP